LTSTFTTLLNPLSFDDLSLLMMQQWRAPAGTASSAIVSGLPAAAGVGSPAMV